MEDILGLICQFLVEFVFGLISNMLWMAFLYRSSPMGFSYWRYVCATLGVGGLAGAVSIYFLPNAFIHAPSWRVVNAGLFPLIVGLVSYEIARWNASKGKDVVPSRYFLFGFLFALAFATVRFAHSQH